MSYSPYGLPNTDITGFAFTGEPRDLTGLQHHRARYYAPTLGTWLSEDVLETPNRYGYVEGDPVNRTDSTGFQSDCQEALPCPSPVNFVSSGDPQPPPRDDNYVSENTSAPILGTFLVGTLLHSTARLAADRAYAAGYPRAAEFLRLFLSNQSCPLTPCFSRETPLVALDVNALLNDLPRFREIASRMLGSNLYSVVYPRQGQVSGVEAWRKRSSAIPGHCKVYSGWTTWDRVGIAGPLSTRPIEPHLNVYPNIDPTIAIFSDNFNRIVGGLDYQHKKELDWFMAMNTFAYSIAHGITINQVTRTISICYKVHVFDQYAWYSNAATGDLDKAMGMLDAAGYAQRFEIIGQSSVRCESISLDEFIVEPNPDNNYFPVAIRR